MVGGNREMKKLIALNGKMASGKTTMAEALRDNLNFTILSIASSIKKASTILIDNTPYLHKYLKEMVKDAQIAEQLYFDIVQRYHSDFNQEVFEKDSAGAYHKTQPYRELTQMVATVVRKSLGEEVWVKFCIQEAKNQAEDGKSIVIDDLRLPEEKHLFEQNGFAVIRLDITAEVQTERLLRMYGEINEEQRNHTTEIALDDALFDLRIDTSSDDSKIAKQALIQFVQSA